MTIQRLNAQRPEFKADLLRATDWHAVSDQAHEQAVADIIRDVQLNGDQALVDMTRKFDRWPSFDLNAMVVSADRLDDAVARLAPTDLESLQFAAKRIRMFHERQKGENWSFEDEYGNTLGQRVTPLDRVGVYVPGGKAAYPSSVLMNIIPAVVAGVPEVVMVVPMPDGQANDWVLAAAKIAGATEVYAIGGAQAVAALAYGTETIRPVDKITGPGNAYVASAKRQVFGRVGIDMIAGPSEICVVCDGKTEIDWIVYDLFSQAEHDEDAQSILISSDAAFLDQVEARAFELLPDMARANVIEVSLKNRALFIEVESLDQAAEVVNQIAPEHLELSVEDPRALSEKVRHAGAIFMGRYTAEALGDYCAGPNHVLPTSRSARFFSPLGVYDFQKRSSVIHCNLEGAQAIGRCAEQLAYAEGLQAHALSAAARFGVKS
ncbi:MAG: histidinol dehydrogenase [Gammaproteobacteria bacterium]|nr:histidinol dehydrogenase [Gammaproteobacteria bacterium]